MILQDITKATQQNIFSGQSDAQSQSTYLLFLKVSERKTYKDIAFALGLNNHTVLRWRELKAVPKHCHYDFLRMLGKSTKEYLKQHKARDKDQFYTKPEIAQYCLNKLNTVLTDLNIDYSKYHFIEPSAGCGWFYEKLPKNRRIGIDIELNTCTFSDSKLICCDYLQWIPEHLNKYIVVGNPPFGLRGHTALQFINHSAGFADVVAFILPQLFDSDGKGTTGKRVKDYKLAHTEALPTNSFAYPNGEDVTVCTVFQVWTKINIANIKIKHKPTAKQYIRIYSLSDGGTPSSTRNKKMLYKCDMYLPSTCFSGMKAYNDFESLPHRRGYGVVIHKNKKEISKILKQHDWTKTAFLSTNSALNLRSSLIESVLTDGGYCDE